MVIRMNRYRILVKGIVQKDDKFLAVEKWYDDNIIDPYQWEFVDGETEFGESPDAAVLRIIQEQTGLIAVVDRILYTWTFLRTCMMRNGSHRQSLMI